VVTIDKSRDRLERQRRRLAERQSRTPALMTVSVPSVNWLSQPGTLFGVGSLIDITGVSLRINPWRFTAPADGSMLRRDFSAIGADMRLATDVVTHSEDPDRPRLFDVTRL
jgi:hypothetical protein